MSGTSGPGWRDTAVRARGAVRRAAGADAAASAAAVQRRAENDELRRAVGALQARLARTEPAATMHEAEFKVFSQWGEDGVLQWLLARVPVPAEVTTFVEIGVEDYQESNTRFLALHDNWRGTAIDGGTAHQDFVRTSELGWRHSVDPVSAFVTAENVDRLLRDAGHDGDLGLLSIDIDGVDYWVWRAVTAVSPRIVVVEHNAVLGPEHAVTVPYDPGFVLAEAHHSGQYFGASLAALHHLARERGYHLVGVGSAGVNAFFVRDDVLGDLPSLTPAEAFVAPRYRTARDRSGALTFETDHRALLAAMRDLPLHDVVAGVERTVGEVYGV